MDMIAVIQSPLLRQRGRLLLAFFYTWALVMGLGSIDLLLHMGLATVLLHMGLLVLAFFYTWAFSFYPAFFYTWV